MDSLFNLLKKLKQNLKHLRCPSVIFSYHLYGTVPLPFRSIRCYRKSIRTRFDPFSGVCQPLIGMFKMLFSKQYVTQKLSWRDQIVRYCTIDALFKPHITGSYENIWWEGPTEHAYQTSCLTRLSKFARTFAWSTPPGLAVWTVRHAAGLVVRMSVVGSGYHSCSRRSHAIQPWYCRHVLHNEHPTSSDRSCYGAFGIWMKNYHFPSQLVKKLSAQRI